MGDAIDDAMGDPIGVFGGTFDPVHNAHLCLAESARSCLSLRAIRWVPTGLPGHRDAPIASPEQRLAMLRLALAGNVHHLIDTAELSSSQPTFTVNTLTRLRAELGARQPLALIIGSDQFTALHTWREWERLFELAHVAVAERPGHAIDAARLAPSLARQWETRQANALGPRPGGCIVPFAMPAMGISSTQIREALSTGRSARHLLPDEVLAYIDSQHLYQPA